MFCFRTKTLDTRDEPKLKLQLGYYVHRVITSFFLAPYIFLHQTLQGMFCIRSYPPSLPSPTKIYGFNMKQKQSILILFSAFYLDQLSPVHVQKRKVYFVNSN